MENLWSNEGHILRITLHIFAALEDQEASCIIANFPQWASLCQTAEVDLDIPNTRIFLEAIIYYWRAFITFEVITKDTWMEFSLALGAIFDEFVNKEGDLRGLKINREIPVAYAAYELAYDFEIMGFRDVGAYLEPSSTRMVDYHGYYVEPRQAVSFCLLEHVISAGIKQRPDSIFDIWKGKTVFNYVILFIPRVWIDILQKSRYRSIVGFSRSPKAGTCGYWEHLSSWCKGWG
jgi:hypothetical protein